MEKPEYKIIQIPTSKGSAEDKLNSMSVQGYKLHTIYKEIYFIFEKI